MAKENKKNNENDVFRIKRNTDKKLWEQVQEYASSDKNKIKAVQIIFSQHYQLPEECIKLIKKLAHKEQPKGVRIQIAKNLGQVENIPFGMYTDLVSILSNDPELEIKEAIVKTQLAIFGETTLKYAEAFSKSLQNTFTVFSPAMQSILNSQIALQRAIGMSGIFKIPASVSSLLDSIHAISLPKQLVGLTSISENLNKLLNNELLKNINSYYLPDELRIVDKPPQLTKASTGTVLIKKLKDCKAGKEDWGNYEDVCKEILLYCFVPPLLEPLEQSKTENDLHKRDLIFHIPHDAGNFWQYLLMKFGMAIIVECKNYQDKLNENTILISSKYLGNGKLTKFGLVLTRKGLNEGGKKGQKSSWGEKKLLICLTDDDLTKMIMLKESNEEPWKVIDNAIREFLQSL
jgi:hypothetical protein